MQNYDISRQVCQCDTAWCIMQSFSLDRRVLQPPTYVTAKQIQISIATNTGPWRKNLPSSRPLLTRPMTEMASHAPYSHWPHYACNSSKKLVSSASFRLTNILALCTEMLVSFFDIHTTLDEDAPRVLCNTISMRMFSSSPEQFRCDVPTLFVVPFRNVVEQTNPPHP